MPFSTDITWSAGLHKLFEDCRHDPPPLRNRYLVPYLNLLLRCFTSPGPLFFTSEEPFFDPSSDADKPELLLVVFDTNRHPVLFAEIKDDTCIGRAESRVEAHNHMVQQYHTMLAGCPNPCLWGLSLLGTSLQVYRGNVSTGSIEPTFDACLNPSDALPHDALEGAWNIDILSPAGFAEMKEIVGDIIGRVADT